MIFYIFLFIRALVLVFIVMIIIRFLTMALSGKGINTSKTMTYKAKVLLKRTNYTEHKRTVNARRNEYETSYTEEYYVSFSVDNNNELSFYVPFKVFSEINEGDNGILTVRGADFIAFDTKLHSK